MNRLTLIMACAFADAASFGCGDLQRFGGDAPPLTTLAVVVTGDLEAVRTADSPDLRIAVVWGAQWLSESTCTTLPATTEETTFLTSGCRHPLFFTPKRAGDSVPLSPNVPFEFPLDDLPGGDVMIGGLSARIAYASLVVFDDRDHSGVLELGRMQRPPYRDTRGKQEDEHDDDNTTGDIVYGASFAAMTEPDTRLAFREGAFNTASAFYPRQGCGEPPPRFGVLAAGGFSVLEAYTAASESRLPSQDPATCIEGTPATMPITIALRPPVEVREAACLQRSSSGTIRYYAPPVEAIDFSDRSFLCRVIPEKQVTELIVTQRTADRCRGLTHYVLRGCSDDERVDCELPEWDFTQSPPGWWPCL
ncbi:MAG: hypothetical protein M4D80_14715 [Myxococcota bacterium]|nr:hypothetical protein [Deltaproteobacteria bacterium]MDQ3336417.1 hypothetical protein [Myxococcota bacterium]